MKKKPFSQHVLLPIFESLQNSIEGKGIYDNSLKSSVRKASKVALQAARKPIKKPGGHKKIRVPRLIPFRAKVGGILPLFAVLSALGSLARGASAVANAVFKAKLAKQKVAEDQRHHQALEEVMGSGLHLWKNAKGGYGLFLRKAKNSQ